MNNEYQQQAGPGMIAHAYSRSFKIGYGANDVWELLLRKGTFTDHQIWPFRVEFINSGTSEYMQTGEDNIHHGPLLCFSGIMGKIDPPHYRDLHYYYGSYFLSFRWIRPNRLQIWVKPEGDQSSIVTIRIDSWVKPSFSGLWTNLQRIFWSNFGRMISRLVRKQVPADQ